MVVIAPRIAAPADMVMQTKSSIYHSDVFGTVRASVVVLLVVLVLLALLVLVIGLTICYCNCHNVDY